MPVSQRGFTLLETLIALALSSAVLIGAGKLFPALQRGILLQYQQQSLEESLWQLAFGVGKNLRRAGYCNGSCKGSGLTLSQEGTCVLIRWDSNSNGIWEPSGHRETELAGYRLQTGSLEMLKGATTCEGKGWQKISDPALMTINYFAVHRHPRHDLPSLLEISLQASLKQSARSVSLRHVVVGYNL